MKEFRIEYFYGMHVVLIRWLCFREFPSFVDHFLFRAVEADGVVPTGCNRKVVWDTCRVTAKENGE